MIGLIFILLVVFFGSRMLSIFYLMPMSILGVLLLFTGGQLSLTIIDLNTRKDLFVALVILGITLASNLAVGFVSGIVMEYILKSEKLQI